jgi:hypothetical protein
MPKDKCGVACTNAHTLVLRAEARLNVLEKQRERAVAEGYTFSEALRGQITLLRELLYRTE